MRKTEEIHKELTRVPTQGGARRLEVEMLLDIRDILDRIRESLRIISLKP